ncbi:P-loop containing nucleoside triphosphate hydrolase protein [Xylogone sp. PMI_703]|nr:P-loop containing nucleoside triphosphate hydrolase protein [Xylogone sp. PMI_703]
MNEESLRAPQTHIDRRKLTRTVPMRVLCLGMPRTGTSSIRAALKQLGYNETYHMQFVDKYTGEGKALTKAEWDGLLGRCQAVIDYPAAIFGPELIAMYPEAKVILTNRDVDKWYISMLNTIVRQSNSKLMAMIHLFDRQFLAHFWPMARDSIALPFEGDFKKNGKEVFKKYYEEIRQIVPKENLLEFEVSQGWGPLCKFLEVPIPDRPFPHVNDTEAFSERVGIMMREAMKRVAVTLSPAFVAMVGVGIGSWFFFRRR